MALQNNSQSTTLGTDALQGDLPPASKDTTSDLLTKVAEALPAGFVLDEERVCTERDGRLTPLCAPILNIARACRADGSGWCSLIRFMAADRVVREAVIPARQLASNAAAVIATLVDQGFEAWGTSNDIVGLLRCMTPSVLLEATDITGWHGEGCDTYVLPDGTTISWTGETVKTGPVRVLFTGVRRQISSHRGTHEAWLRSTVATADLSPIVAVSICAAIAPVLLAQSDAPSFLVHLFGEERANTACRILAASIWGAPGTLEVSWEKPTSELVAAIGQARDGLLILSGYDARHAKKAAAVASVLSASNGHYARKGKVVVLSTGSAPISTSQNQHGTSVLRNTVDLDTRSWRPIEIDDVLAEAGRMYGFQGPAVVHTVIAYTARNPGKLSASVQRRCKDVLDAMRTYPAPADAETISVSQALGTLLATGSFISNRDILPWKLGALEDVFRNLATQWMTEYRGLLSEADRALLATLAETVAAFEPELVSLKSADIRDTAEGLGWHDAQWLYLAAPAMTELAVAADQPHDQIVKLLMEQGLLKPGMERGHKFRMTSRIAGRPRAFRVSRDLLRFCSNNIWDQL